MSRIEKLVKAMPEEMDAAIIVSPVGRRYFTGFASSAGTLLVTRKGASFIIDSRYHEAAQATIKDIDVVFQEELSEQLPKLLSHYGAKSVGLESDGVTMRECLELEKKLEGYTVFTDNRLSDEVRKLRMIKDQREIDLIQAAQSITDQAFTHILNFIKPGRTEREIATELEFYCIKQGSEGAAFPYIVVSGSNSSKPHGVPSYKEVENGDFITMDFGCLVGRYCSDMTRTVALGSISEKQRRVYETVLEAQLLAMEHIKPGVACSDVDKAARDYINTKDSGVYNGLFGHGLGHSLGIEVHETPCFNKLWDIKLEPGMVLSVEPGIYLPGEFGVRIEDIIAVTDNGFYNFAVSQKQLIVL